MHSKKHFSLHLDFCLILWIYKPPGRRVGLQTLSTSVTAPVVARLTYTKQYSVGDSLNTEHGMFTGSRCTLYSEMYLPSQRKSSP